MPQATPAHDFTDAGRGERLQRVLADAGIGSRRACEELILAGEVEVNGQLVAELPAWVDPDEDRIVAQGRPVPRPERKLYVLLNKPARTLSTVSDEPGADRRTVTDLVDHPGASRLFPVGRLDYDTVGLILLTNDGELANRLTHPRYGVPKTYRIVVKGLLGEEAVKELERGIYLADRKAGQTVGAKRTAHVEFEILSQNRQSTTLELTLREGRNRQVRRMMAAVGYPVHTLERVGMGPIRLKGVARGAWRELTRDEIWALKRASADSSSAGSGDAPAKAGSKAGSRAGTKPPRPGAKKTPGRGTKQTDRSTGKSGARAGTRTGGRTPYEPPPLDPGLPIRRRTMKNAINRATKGDSAKPALKAETEAASGTSSSPTPKPASKPAPKAGPKLEPKLGPKPSAKPTPKPGAKPTPRRGTGDAPARGAGARDAAPRSGDRRVEGKPGPKTGSKPGSKAGAKPGSKPAANGPSRTTRADKPTGRPAGRPDKPAGRSSGPSKQSGRAPDGRGGKPRPPRGR